MRNILSLLFALIMITLMVSCSPNNHPNNSSQEKEIEINLHDAPFEKEDFYSIDSRTGKKEYRSSIFRSGKYQKCSTSMWEFNGRYDDIDAYYAVSSDKRFAYILRIVGYGEATLETYSKCPTDESHEHQIFIYTDEPPTCFKPTNEDYYSATPVAAYYFRFEKGKYAYVTEDYKIGETVEIKGCWNIGPGREEIEGRSDYLDGFVYFADYKTLVRAFVYRCEEYSNGIDVYEPSYMVNQIYKGYDSFNADGETKEGWNNKLSMLSGYTLDRWKSTSNEPPYSDLLADYRKDMKEIQMPDGSWIEVIVTETDD